MQCLPTDLEGLYQRILEDLETNGDDSDIAIGKRIFQLVLFACRPLTVPELQHALAITDCGGTESTTDTFITPSDEFFEDGLIAGIEKRIVHCGRNFLEVKGQKFKGEPIVQVMHQTVRDFFLRQNGSVANSKFRMSEYEAHRMISTICIQYLVFCAQHPRVTIKTTSKGDEFELPPLDSWMLENFVTYIQYLHERPLINYALEHLQTHICRCPEAMNSNISLISELKKLPAGNPARYVFGDWVSDHLNQVLFDSLQREAASKFRNNILWIAARTGYYQVADVLLTAGAQIDIRLQGKTPLEVSAENGHEATVQRLLARGAGIDTPDSDQCTALHRAAMNGHDATVRLLLDGGSNIEARNSDHCTALHKAAQNGHDAAIKLLIDRGAHIHAQDSDQCQALHSAAMNGHEGSVRLLLDYHANIQNTGYDQWTPLHRAAENGQVTTVQLLIDRGALIDAQDSSGCTALHCAAKNGYKATVRLLLNCGAHIEAHTFERCTALHLAAKNGHKDTVRILLDCGADIQAQPIHHEVASDHMDTEKALSKIKKFLEDFDAIFQGKQPPSDQPFGLVLDRHFGIAWSPHPSDMFCDSIGMSALHWAAANGHEATVRLLLDCGAHIEAQNSRGWTALHWAAKCGREATVRLLLDRGAHIGAQDIDGWTALHRATEWNRMAIVELLQERSQY
jgi:ankyrin repeat protein